MKSYIFIFLMLIIGCNFSKIENSTERKQNFNNNWKFYPGDNAEASKTEFNDSEWRELNLPHDWSIEGDFNAAYPAGNDGAYLPTGIGWYRKVFDIPKNWEGKKVSIYFEGVYMNSELFVNGKSVGFYPYGYSSFYYDLTPFLNFGRENTIAVRVDNSKQKNCRWYSGSGIYRHVWLMLTEPVHFQHWGIGITSQNVTLNCAKVEIKAKIVNESNKQKTIVVLTDLYNASNIEAGNSKSKTTIEANSVTEVTQEITVSNPALWSPETPDLYTAGMVISENGKDADKTQIDFGIRSIKFSAENGFELNGKKVLLNGGCVHHDNGCLGQLHTTALKSEKWSY